MIYATKIEFTFKEGNVGDTPRTVYTWNDADRLLRQWAKDAPATGGYDKTDFTISWSDGGKHEGRFDLQYRDGTRHTKLGLLADHVVEFLTFHTGQRKPSHMTQEDYENLLRAFKTDCAEYIACLQSHIFTDNPSDCDYAWFMDTNEYKRDSQVYTVEPQAPTVINGRTAYLITIIDAADGRAHSGISFHVDFASAYDYAARVILRDYAPQSTISSITLTTL